MEQIVIPVHGAVTILGSSMYSFPLCRSVGRWMFRGASIVLSDPRVPPVQEKEELIQEWTPEPLVPDDADQNPIKYDVIQGKVRNAQSSCMLARHRLGCM